MKRFLFLILVGALAAIATWYGVRISQKTSNVAVSALLPRETILFAHVPDFNRTRDQWHHSDIYQLYREPAVQDFLHKPLASLPKRDATAQALQEIEQLDPKDAFVAITSIDNNNPRFAGGFRFRGSQDAAEAIVGKWRAKLLEKKPTAKREKIAYQQHQIETIAAAPFTLATAYDGHWFFASSGVAELKALLDRADRRSKDRQGALDGDESYRAAAAHMPSSYAALIYLQPKIFATKLASLRAAIGQQITPDQRTMLENVRGICGTTRFENGKIHDVIFVGMPELQKNALITRSSIALGSKDTFFYLAMLPNLEKLEGFDPGSAALFGAWFQKFLQALSRSGITIDDWKAAFDLELGALADWPEKARWPSAVATFRVKDSGRASRIVGVLTSAIDEDGAWTKTEKEGVRHFFLQSPASWIAITPTITLSDKVLVAGLDPNLVQATMKRGASSASELSASQSYKTAARLVPIPTNLFVYFDLPLLYSRLDATLRPMLLMGAAFMPAMSDYVDASKLPAPEVITKHLSPIVYSQRYERDGYMAESVGPVTLNQAAIGLGLPAAFWAIDQQRGR
jgi:hypothetical protein